MFVLKRFRSSLLFLTFLCLSSLSLAGCPYSLNNPIDPDKICTWHDQVLQLGDVIGACGQCECTEDGVVCSSEPCIDPPVCADLGFEPGDSWPHEDGCNTCSCLKGGDVVCTKMLCPPQCEPAPEICDGVDNDCNGLVDEAENCCDPTLESLPTDLWCGWDECQCIDFQWVCGDPCPPPQFCEYDGKYYEPGDMWTHSDDCNTCSCLDDGQVVCTEIACPHKFCIYDGEYHVPGDTFGECDECECQDDGQVICADAVWCPLKGCEVDGEYYEPGETFGECDECQCLEGGMAVCSDIWCPPLDGCTDLGYEPGEFKQIGCELCTCIEDGMEVCEDLADCQSGCDLNGVHYEVGETFGECDECQCHEDGMTTCGDTLWCPPKGCEVDGEYYEPGESFGECDECECLENGQVICADVFWCPPICEPEVEICDGVDNDCDGVVDEGSVCCPEFIISPQDPCMNCSCTEDGWVCDDSECEPQCVYQGDVYYPGEIFGGCGQCVCTDTGEVMCDLAICIEPLSCEGKAPGEVISLGCLDCLCLSEDLFVCFDSCGNSNCEYEGVEYAVGEVFGACDECTCTSGGVACLAIDCGWKEGSEASTPKGD